MGRELCFRPLFPVGRFSGLSSFLLPKTQVPVDIVKRPAGGSIDFTAAGTAPELHRIPILIIDL